MQNKFAEEKNQLKYEIEEFRSNMDKSMERDGLENQKWWEDHVSLSGGKGSARSKRTRQRSNMCPETIRQF